MELADVCRTCFSPDNIEYTIFDVIPLENQPSEIMVIDLLGLIPRISVSFPRLIIYDCRVHMMGAMANLHK